MAKKKELTPKREFIIIGVIPGPVYFKNKNYDLSRLSQEQAVYLIDNGCPYINWKDQEEPEAPAEQ